MTLQEVFSSLREWSRRVLGALSGRRTDHDLRRELAGHVALAEDELRRRGHAPKDAARLARAAAGGRTQALETLREQRGLPWLGSSWLDVKLGLRLLVRNWGLTLVGGLAMTLAIASRRSSSPRSTSSCGVRFRSTRGTALSPSRCGTARPAGGGTRRGRTSSVGAPACNRSTTSARSRRPGATSSRPTVRSSSRRSPRISPAGFRVARVPPLIGRPIADADAAPGAAPVVVIGHDVWQRRFAGAQDVIGRELRLGNDVHTVVGVMPAGFQFPFNFRVLGSAPARGRRDAAQHRSRRRRLRPARAGRDARARAR